MNKNGVKEIKNAWRDRASWYLPAREQCENSVTKTAEMSGRKMKRLRQEEEMRGKWTWICKEE